MERDLVRALRGDRNPQIEFTFTRVLGIEHDIEQHLYRVGIEGVISLAGTSRTVSVTITASRVSPSRFRITAELPLRMSDFGIAPPTALLGMIHARDELRVRFDLLLESDSTHPALEVSR